MPTLRSIASSESRPAPLCVFPTECAWPTSREPPKVDKLRFASAPWVMASLRCGGMTLKCAHRRRWRYLIPSMQPAKRLPGRFRPQTTSSRLQDVVTSCIIATPDFRVDLAQPHLPARSPYSAATRQSLRYFHLRKVVPTSLPLSDRVAFWLFAHFVVRATSALSTRPVALPTSFMDILRCRARPNTRGSASPPTNRLVDAHRQTPYLQRDTASSPWGPWLRDSIPYFTTHERLVRHRGTLWGFIVVEWASFRTVWRFGCERRPRRFWSGSGSSTCNYHTPQVQGSPALRRYCSQKSGDQCRSKLYPARTTTLRRALLCRRLRHSVVLLSAPKVLVLLSKAFIGLRRMLLRGTSSQSAHLAIAYAYLVVPFPVLLFLRILPPTAVTSYTDSDSPHTAAWHLLELRDRTVSSQNLRPQPCLALSLTISNVND
uniref:Uncharacterized protein n=1 Tax=Mycena chlorophos TaxID=658473 RepID=A0ABQ0MDH1_MYCCL|nr:predicted protein [Mycena chlorophos]